MRCFVMDGVSSISSDYIEHIFNKIKAQGFENFFDFKDGLRRTIDWHLANPSWRNHQSEVQ